MILESDLVLVHVDNKPGFYARLEEITPMSSRLVAGKTAGTTFPLQVSPGFWRRTADEAPFTMEALPPS